METKDKKILIIEDDSRSLKLLEYLLANSGSLETASNGREGLEKLKKSYFDAVVSDVDMPYMSGLELYVEAEKEDPDLKNRIIFYSAMCSSDCMAFFREKELCFIRKPSSIHLLREMLEHILEKGFIKPEDKTY